MKIGDEWRFPQPRISGFSSVVDATLPDSVVLSSEAAEILSAVLEQLADFQSSPRGALLVSGNFGMERSHFLAFLESLLADPDYPLWKTLLECLGLGEDMRPKTPVRTLSVCVPQDSSKNLISCLLETLRREIPGNIVPPVKNEGPSDEFTGQILPIASALAKNSVRMVILESISDRIDQLKDAERHQNELHLYQLFARALSQHGILTVMIGREEHLVSDWQQDAAGSGDSTEHHCTWIDFTEDKPAGISIPSGQEEEFQERCQLLLYDWIHAEIPSWKPERSPNYRHASQALPATIPEGDQKLEGLVYFKSVYDPSWSGEDLDRLRRKEESWILLVLNPCERFYELESRLKEMAAALPALVIWRPGTPSKTELETLRNLTLEMPSETVEGDVTEEGIIRRIRAIITDLYIHRGSLADASRQRAIREEIGTREIGQYLSDCLSSLQSHSGPAIQPEAKQETTGGEYRTRHWAALLTGNGTLREGSSESAQARLMEWLALSADGFAKNISGLPESFQTTRFWNEVKMIEAPLRVLRTVLYSLRSGAFSFFEAIDHVGRCFGWDEQRLLKWKQGLENVAGVARWLPAFVHANEYLTAAFPLGREYLDGMRESLLQSIQEPHRFLDSKARNDFDERFADFKKSYMDSYFLLHEEALHVMSGLKKDELRIDPVALRNLDLLSGLHHTDKSYLNRVKLLAKWIQQNQCNLPLHEILNLYPRCYCNFNPSSRQQPAGAAAQINAIIQEGLEYFRTILRRCSHLIMAEVRKEQMDDNSLKQIIAAMGDGPMLPLKAPSIKILNKIIVKYSSEFLAEIRKAGIKVNS